MAIASLRGFAVDAIKISCKSMILTLNGFYSIYAKKRDSQGHLKRIKKLKITHRNCCSVVITLCSPKTFLVISFLHFKKYVKFLSV